MTKDAPGSTSEDPEINQKIKFEQIWPTLVCKQNMIVFPVEEIHMIFLSSNLITIPYSRSVYDPWTTICNQKIGLQDLHSLQNS